MKTPHAPAFHRILFLCLFIGAASAQKDRCFVQLSDDGLYDAQICFNSEGVPYLKDNEFPNDNVGWDMDTMYLILMGALVFFMQTGFAMLEAGAVHIKNVQNILYKNLMDASLGALIFYIFGFGFAYGGDGTDNPFIGSDNFALSKAGEGTYRDWFFQYTFAATAATIVSGSVAERCKLEAYFAYACILTLWVYPVVVHWIWDTEGWLTNLGIIDFAGSSVVHLVGGTAGFVGAFMLGPRWDTFDQQTGEVKEKFVAPHETLLQSLGTTFLWFGWYGFNCGSTLGINGSSEVASRVAVTTTLSAATAGLTSAMLSRILYEHHNLGVIFNSILTGLVSICACCATIEPYMAIPVGFMAAIVYNVGSRVTLMLKVDDPLDAAAVHGFGGMWGILCPGIFSAPHLIEAVYGMDGEIYTSGRLFGVQLLGLVVVFFWSLINSFIVFGIMKATFGLRVDIEVEKLGLDSHEHGGMKLTDLNGNFHNSKLNLALNFGLVSSSPKKNQMNRFNKITEIAEEDEDEDETSRTNSKTAILVELASEKEDVEAAGGHAHAGRQGHGN